MFDSTALEYRFTLMMEPSQKFTCQIWHSWHCYSSWQHSEKCSIVVDLLILSCCLCLLSEITGLLTTLIRTYCGSTTFAPSSFLWSTAAQGGGLPRTCERSWLVSMTMSSSTVQPQRRCRAAPCSSSTRIQCKVWGNSHRPFLARRGCNVSSRLSSVKLRQCSQCSQLTRWHRRVT